jgi:hypothetical protein
MEPEVNINDPRLQAILGKSKAVMQEAERRNPGKKNKVQENYTNPAPQQEYLEREPPAPQMSNVRRRDEPMDPNSPEYAARVQKSKMPSAIKEMMLKNPLSQEPMQEQSVNRVYSANELDNPTPQPVQENRNPAPQNTNRPVVNEGSVSREEIKSIIKEVLAEMMVKTISESSIKRTLKTLMNEGKIRPKK